MANSTQQVHVGCYVPPYFIAPHQQDYFYSCILPLKYIDFVVVSSYPSDSPRKK